MKLKAALILAGKYIQDQEFIYPFYRLQEAGYDVDVAIRNKEIVQGQIGVKIVPTMDIPTNYFIYDLLVIPGGAKAMEYMRQDRGIINLVGDFHKDGKVIASICHGAQLLISAKIVVGHTIAGYYSIEDDIINAGAKYSKEVTVSDRIVTAAHYKDLGLWMKKALEEVEKV